MTVAGRLRRGLAANAFGQAVTLAVQVATVPLLLWAWGDVGMGEWLLIGAIPAQLVSGDLGLPAVAANLMVMAVVANDRAEARRVFDTTLASVSALGLLLLLPLLLASTALPLADWFGLTTVDAHSLDLTLALLVARMWLIMIGGVLVNAFRCDGHYATGALLSNVVRLFEFLCMALAIGFGGGMVAAAGAMVASQIVGLAVLAMALRRCSPWLRIGFGEARVATLRRMIRPALSFVALPIASACNQQAPLVIAGVLLGPQATAALATGRTLARMAQQANSIIGSATWSELSRAFGEGAVGRMRTLNRASVATVFWLGLGSVAALGLLGPEVYRIWTGSRIDLDVGMFLLLLAASLANSVWSMMQMALIASNHHSGVARAQIVAALILVAVCYAAGAAAGLVGIAASLLLYELAVGAAVAWASLRLTADTPRAFLAHIGDPGGLYRLWRAQGRA